MATLTKRATVYFDPDLHRILKIKAATTSKSISEIIDTFIRQELTQDEEDLRIFEDRINEPTVSYETALKKLKNSGKL